MNHSHLLNLASRPSVLTLRSALGAGNARLVGGAVRDALLGLEVTDLDLATPLSPYEVMRRCGAAGIRTIPTGISHGTITALVGEEKLEITTLRADLRTDGRRAEVAFTDDWLADAQRRDFTINAIYFDPGDEQLFDPCGGLDDLSAGRVRFIGAPLERIAEDHLRILRFFRFTARFGATTDTASLTACANRANDLMALSRERIADEIFKLLALPDPSGTIGLMIEHGIFEPVLPEVVPDGATLLRALARAEGSAGLPPDPLRRLASILPRDAQLADRIAARLKLSKRARKQLASAAIEDLDRNAKALAYGIGIKEAQDRLLLAGRPLEAALLTGWDAPSLPIGGGELIRLGLVPGPVVARTLKMIEERWVEEDFPEGEPLMRIVETEVAEAQNGS